MNQLINFTNYLKNLFPFIKKENKEKFSMSGTRNQCHSKKQINAILNWFHKELFQKILQKYKLSMRRIVIEERRDGETENTSLEIDICVTEKNVRKACPFAIYKQKELTFTSNESFQMYINAGANFPSVRFTKQVTRCLNSEFMYSSNDLGKYKHNLTY
jgi:hypothetical protein